MKSETASILLGILFSSFLESTNFPSYIICKVLLNKMYRFMPLGFRSEIASYLFFTASVRCNKIATPQFNDSLTKPTFLELNFYNVKKFVGYFTARVLRNEFFCQFSLFLHFYILFRFFILIYIAIIIYVKKYCCSYGAWMYRFFILDLQINLTWYKIF